MRKSYLVIKMVVGYVAYDLLSHLTITAHESNRSNHPHLVRMRLPETWFPKQTDLLEDNECMGSVMFFIAGDKKW